MISNVLRCMIVGLLSLSLVQAQETQGTPGVDYPNFVNVPNSSFKCSDQEIIPGFYADLETQCQAYHYCSEEGQETFLCPIGSIFNQAKLVCDAWHNFNCTLSTQFYSSNSGFLLESAMKSVPLLIKLRNRAAKRLSLKVPATNVFEKITSLYDGSELEQSSTEGSSVSIDVNAEQKLDTNEEQEEQLNEDESLEDILSRLEASIQNDEPADEMYYDNDDRNEALDNMQTKLFFDSVTEQYYMDPESSQNEWSQNLDYDQFRFYDRDNFAYKYSLAMQDAEESRDSVESSEPTDLYGLKEMNYEAPDQFLKRQMNIEQPMKRFRRKPIYTVTQDYEDELSIGMREDMESEDFVTTESIPVLTDVSSQPSAETTETWRVSNTRAPFEMIEDLSRMHMTPLNITEVPMTSEEFEDAIISELIVPKLDEHDLRVLGSTSDKEQSNEGYADDSGNVQNDGFYRYVENESPDQFVYSNVYDAESDAKNVELDSGTSYQIDDTAEYYQDEVVNEDSEKSDTFVVIPDDSEIPEFSEAFDKTESLAESAFKDLSGQNVKDDASDSMYFNIPTNYESQGAYSVADPSKYRTSRYSQSEYDPRHYFQQRYFNPENEESSSPYDYTDKSYVADDARPVGSNIHHYTFEANDPTNQYMHAPAPYACQQQFGYANCMYGTQSGYPYGGYYHNPYVQYFPYSLSDVEESSESPVSGIDGSYSSESPMSYMIQSDANMNEQLDINTDYEISNSYQDRNFAVDYPDEESPDNSGTILSERVNKETYYVLEDDEKTTEEANPESIYGPSSLDSINGISDVTGNKDETYYILDDEDEEKVMEDGSEDETFADISENEEDHEQQDFSKDKSLNLEESSSEHSADGTPSQTVDSEDFSQSEANSALGGSAESVFGSTMDSTFTRVTNGGSFTTKTNRNGEILDSSEILSQNDETSEVSSHNIPDMFMNNMEYSDSINFGSRGFSSSLGQPTIKGSPTAFSFANGRKRTHHSVPPNVSKLSALQERIRSLKQGKFGAFKKYVSSSGTKF